MGTSLHPPTPPPTPLPALGHRKHARHMCQTGSSILFLSDAKDTDQLGRNKITHIISIHESPQPLLQVLLIPIPGFRA